MRVLVPSDNRDFLAELVAAYNHAGCDVVAGTFNFDMRSAEFDLVHYQWPEELCGWKPPSDHRLSQIKAHLEWWQNRCPSIVTVHNFYMQGFEGNPQLKDLYETFYHTCSVVHHFSEASKRLICGEFAGSQHNRHIVSTPWNYDVALSKQKKRGSCREEFGFTANDFVILVMGALRSWEEIQLITKAFSFCRVQKKRLLMAGRYYDDSGRWRRKWRQLRWRSWLRSHGAAVEERFIPDEELYRFLDTADVVLVPRLRELTSGIPSLAMSFGTTVLAPSHGACQEFLKGTANFLYKSGDPQSLARALEQAASADRKRIGLDNRHVADQWRMANIVGSCLESLPSCGKR